MATRDFAYAGALIAVFVLACSAPADAAKKRPTIGGPDACIGYDCDGLICSCCFEDGCWICGVLDGQPYWKTCEWDPAYKKWRKGFTIIPPGGGVLDPGPPVTNTRPYTLPRGGVLSP